MDINNEIKKIIEYQNSSLPKQNRKNDAHLETIIEQVSSDYNSGNFDFSKFTDIVIKRSDKIKHMKMYKPFSCEDTLCIYLKRLLDRKFHIKYPNRNEYMHSLFDIVNALHNMNDYSIFRFDFENFFNSVSSEYVFSKYISKGSFERYQIDLLQAFVKSTKYAYAGLNTSNIICEIISKHFDTVLSLKLRNHGLIFYRRYIDDGILIFNKRIGNDTCLRIINEAIQEVFYNDVIKNCKTKLNTSKTKYISVHDVCARSGSDDFDFLGYKFVLTPSVSPKTNQITTTFKYGITQNKIDKYTKRINDIVKEYQMGGTKNIELLRHQLKAFSFRTVYQLPKYKSIIWKTKGFISNYQELRYRMEFLTDETRDFLKNSILNAFIVNDITMPYFLRGNINESIYNLYNNMRKYRTLLFVEPIGINFDSLEKMCKQIGIILDGPKSYERLVREYLIKVKVGH
ncbi:MAG: hypothetical protein J1F63_03430 [Oscillospiraceae bacterium]|nr:hypothetical protein [Oscillospiraceae bacterium]